MKTIGIRQLQANIGTTIADAQGEPVVVLRHARPVAVIVGVSDGAEATKVIEHAERLKKGANMNPPKTAVLFRLDEIARSAILGPLVSISLLRERVRQDGITDRGLFDSLLFDLEADGILELFVSGNPQDLSQEDQAGSLVTANRELIATTMRRAHYQAMGRSR